MQEVILNLTISADEYLKLYRGEARMVIARAVDGRTVRFPAQILKSFVTRDGIKGVFSIQFAEGGKFQGIRRLNA